MFDILFGWRKASKCKKLIKRVQCRLKLLKNKRFAIARQLKEDIAQLLKDGQDHIAFNRLEQLYMDESIMSVHEMLDNFSEFIVLNLSYIRKHKDIPNDIREAVSTLIFASVRFGDLPELRLVRKLFGERYGQRLVTSAVEGHPGSLVNHQVKEKLIPKPLPEDVKNRLLDEIVRDYLFKSGPLALEYKPEFHAQQGKVQVTKFGQVKGQDRDVKESSTSSNCSVVLQSYPERQIVDNFTQLSLPYEHISHAIEERRDSASTSYSSESSVQYPEQSVIYLDDVQEFKSPTKQGLHCQDDDQDQRFFVFKSSWMCKMETLKELEVHNEEHNKTLPRKRVRRRSISREKRTVNNAYCETYYINKSHNQRKYRKKNEVNSGKEMHFLDQGRYDCASRHRCSLDQPCYFYTNGDEGHKGYEIELWREKSGVEDVVEYQVCREEIEEMDTTSPLPQTPSKDIVISPPLVTKCGLRPPYIRAATMPQQRRMGTPSKDMSRSHSLPVNCVTNSASPKHVHPKLPDYDEITAMFIELKKVHRQNKYYIS